MEPQRALPARLDNDVERIARATWKGLAAAGADIPPNPRDLDLSHLARAQRAGIDVGAILDAATPRSGAPAAA